MARPLIFIHGYSDKGESFLKLCDALKESLKGQGTELIEVDICTYVSLNNEVTIKDIAEGLDRAFRYHPKLNATPDFDFDAIVHSTGMLVIRSWLTNYGIKSTAVNNRLKRLKHLIGIAPATWGSPQAHKGRTWLGALIKGNKVLGPDFLNAGDRVLEGLELGSSFTWDLAHMDLLGKEPYYDKGPNTPYVAVFIGNTPYEGLESVANDPGTDGTVRWAGCGLNARKIRIDLTRTPTDPDGNPVPLDNGVPAQRAWISDFADTRLDIPMIAVDGRDHGTILSDPEEGMVGLIARFLKVGEEGGENHDDWLASAKDYSSRGVSKMLVNPDPTFFGRLFHNAGEPMVGWQQFVVHATDERGDPVTDYMVEVLRDGELFKPIYSDVHAYGLDQSFRCFHIHLPKKIMSPDLKLTARIHASTGTDLMTYQGYSPAQQQLTAESQPVELELNLGPKGSLFFPFTTTLIEIVLNREPRPLDQIGKILTWIQESKPAEN